MTKKITVSAKVKVKPDVISRKVQNEEVILNLMTGTYFGLNEVGTRIWTLLKEKTPLSKISEQIQTEYEVEPKTAEKDLLALVKNLKKCDLIEIR